MTNPRTPRAWTSPDEVPAGTIVVGWDASAHAEAALSWALDQARGERRPVTLAHAVAVSAAGEVALWADEEQLRATADDILEEARPHLGTDVTDVEIGAVVATGEPRHLLTTLSRRAALLVIGSHGRGPVRSKVLGSVGVAAVRHASCPTVVVRPSAGRQGVLAAVDVDDDTATTVAEFGFHEASVLRLPLTVVHRVPDDCSQVMVDNARRQVSETLAGLQEQYPDVDCTTVVQRGTTDEVVVDQSEDRHLTVIGAPRHTRRHLTTTASRLMEHSQSPVAVVPLGHSPRRRAAEAVVG